MSTRRPFRRRTLVARSRLRRRAILLAAARKHVGHQPPRRSVRIARIVGLLLTTFVGGQAHKMVVLGGFAEVSGDGKLTVLADLADSVEDFDRGVLAEKISTQEEKVKELEGSALDKAIERLDQFRQIDSHLQGTALH